MGLPEYEPEWESNDMSQINNKYVKSESNQIGENESNPVKKCELNRVGNSESNEVGNGGQSETSDEYYVSSVRYLMHHWAVS